MVAVGHANASAGAVRRQHSLGAIALVILASCAVPDGTGSRQPASYPPAPPPPAPSPPAPSPPEPVVRASRLFAGPRQYPPEDFAAYGILAFRSGATSQSAKRYVAICEGFLAGLPAAADLTRRGVPLAQQMATVWPLDSSALANDLNGNHTDSVPLGRCKEIVAGIDLITSRVAIATAKRASDGESFERGGPYLIAWSPSTAFGQPYVPVLIWDLSGVTTSQQATDQFVDWADEIVRNPDLWRDGWDLERLRMTLRRWADKYGPAILHVLNFGDV